MAERRSAFPLYLLAFCAGCLSAALVPALPPRSWILFGLALSLVAGVLFRRNTAALVVVCVVPGAAWFLLNSAAALDDAWPESRSGEVVEVTGRVVGLPDHSGGRARFEFRPGPDSRANGVPDRVLVAWYWPGEWFQPGETWRLTLRLHPPRARRNPGTFDFQRYLLARGIGATARVQSATRLEPPDLVSAPNRFRQRFADWLQAETKGLDAAALHRALTVGDRGAMSPELADRLRGTGTAHLLAISGLHVGMVATLAGLLAGLITTPRRFRPWWPDRRRYMLAAGLLAALGYAMLAGFSLPTQRALVMLVAGFGALMLRRPIRPGHALLVALAAVLVLDPKAPLATGFWLSFCAVAVLIWTFAWRPGQSGWLAGLVRAQLLIAIGMLPFNIGLFQQLVPGALPANLIAIPLISLWVLPALMLALGGFLAGQFPAAAVAISEQGLEVLLAIIGAIHSFEISTIARPAPGTPAIVLAGLGALWLLAPRGWPGRPLGAILLLPLLFPPVDRPAPGSFAVHALDVGDGLAVAVQTQNHTLLYDTGPGDGGRISMIDGTVAPALRTLGIASVDRIVVSHGARGHAGGRAAARRAWPAAGMVETGTGGDPENRCVQGLSWDVDGVVFRVLHPSPGLPDLGPNSSCVLEVASRAGRVLLAGGVDAHVMRRLARDRPERYDLLVVPRAGHRESVDQSWLDVARPTWSIVSVGADNRWGLPHEQALQALERAGSRVLSTADCGAISMRFRPDKEPDRVMEVHRSTRFWRDASRCLR